MTYFIHSYFEDANSNDAGDYNTKCEKDSDCDGILMCKDTDRDSTKDKCKCPTGSKYQSETGRCIRGRFPFCVYTIVDIFETNYGK